MDPLSKMRKLGIAAGLLALLIILWNPLNNLIYAIRLASSLQKMATGFDGNYSDVKESKISRYMGGREYRALIYRPTGTEPTKALIIAPGISELGCYHPRLIALSRLLAHQGLFVITPDIEEFRNFQISAGPIDQILLWHREAAGLNGAPKKQKIGLAGVSYSGTLALIAAAKPEVRDKVAFVITIGAYQDLGKCTREWFATEPEAEKEQYYPTKFYARWVIMLSALDMLPNAPDRIFLKEVLYNLLLVKTLPPADGLTPDGERWYKLATGKKSPSDLELAQAIEKHLTPRLYQQLDPELALQELRCPVYLIHGAYDDLIPSRESIELHRRIPNSVLFVSPFLTHTHPANSTLTWKQKAAAALDALVFSYRLSEAIR
jgi:pimeloyl-ACP methyl ester carboxylesterase